MLEEAIKQEHEAAAQNVSAVVQESYDAAWACASAVIYSN